MIAFNLPTLVTLTAPTCGGKNHLLEALISDLGFERIVSTTDRAPRKGEVEGVAYFFISTDESKRLEAADEYAELLTYNGTRYGVTHKEMDRAMSTGRPPIVILTPDGIDIYRKYCTSRGWQLFNVYVETQESIRLERLVKRTANDIVDALRSISFDHAPTPEEADEFASQVISKVVGTNNKRLVAIMQQERNWSHTHRWDVIASGTNTEEALDYVARGIANRNSRKDIYA